MVVDSEPRRVTDLIRARASAKNANYVTHARFERWALLFVTLLHADFCVDSCGVWKALIGAPQKNFKKRSQLSEEI